MRCSQLTAAAQLSDPRRTGEGINQDRPHTGDGTDRLSGGCGIQFAYRRFGPANGRRVPLVFFNHFRGNLDTSDPAITGAFAAGREVVLFGNAG